VSRSSADADESGKTVGLWTVRSVAVQNQTRRLLSLMRRPTEEGSGFVTAGVERRRREPT
jgi:hypothetical protein